MASARSSAPPDVEGDGVTLPLSAASPQSRSIPWQLPHKLPESGWDRQSRDPQLFGSCWNSHLLTFLEILLESFSGDATSRTAGCGVAHMSFPTLTDALGLGGNMLARMEALTRELWQTSPLSAEYLVVSIREALYAPVGRARQTQWQEFAQAL